MVVYLVMSIFSSPFERSRREERAERSCEWNRTDSIRRCGYVVDDDEEEKEGLKRTRFA